MADERRGANALEQRASARTAHRRRHALTMDILALAFAGLTSFSLAACVTGPDPESAKRAKAWKQVLGATKAVPLGNDRIRIDAASPFVQDIAITEYNVLARASGEAVRRGSDRFVIAYADYDDGPFGSFLMPDFDMPQASYIGTYEGLLEARSLSGMGNVGDGVGFRSLTVVVRLLGEDELESLPAFDANGFYDAMLEERIDRRNIRPNSYIPVRSYLPFFKGEDEPAGGD